jgi:hypothetical protein
MFGRKNEPTMPLTAYFKRQQLAWNAQNKARDECGVKILNPLQYLCDDTSCYSTLNSIPIYIDDDHLNERGGSLLIPMFKDIFIESE